jgi:hypothetical protein
MSRLISSINRTASGSDQRKWVGRDGHLTRTRRTRIVYSRPSPLLGGSGLDFFVPADNLAFPKIWDGTVFLSPCNSSPSTTSPTRAYLLKEDFQWFWHYVSPAWAGKFLEGWCKRAMRSRIEPMKKVAKMLRGHHDLLLNWFVAKQALLSLGVVEGFNNKARVVTKRAYGFRSYELLELALYQTLGHLPEPKVSHEFF